MKTFLLCLIQQETVRLILTMMLVALDWRGLAHGSLLLNFEMALSIPTNPTSPLSPIKSSLTIAFSWIGVFRQSTVTRSLIRCFQTKSLLTILSASWLATRHPFKPAIYAPVLRRNVSCKIISTDQTLNSMIALDYYVDDSANGITLRADLHLHFDAGGFVLMPLLMPPRILVLRWLTGEPKSDSGYTLHCLNLLATFFQLITTTRHALWPMSDLNSFTHGLRTLLCQW